MRSRTVAILLVVLGLVIAIGAGALLFFAVFYAEAGAGLTFTERLLITTPMAVAAALLIGCGRLGIGNNQHPEPRGAHRAILIGGIMLGAVAGMAALLYLTAGA